MTEDRSDGLSIEDVPFIALCVLTAAGVLLVVFGSPGVLKVLGALVATLGAFAIIAAAVTSSEPVVILSQLPDELREPLRPFIRRGREELTVSEVRQFYRAAGELMQDRAELFRHQAELVNATSGFELATALAQFIEGLSVEDRALLQHQQRHDP